MCLGGLGELFAGNSEHHPEVGVLSAQFFLDLIWLWLGPCPRVVWPRKIVAFPCSLVLLRPWNSCCGELLVKTSRSEHPMRFKQGKTNLSRTIKLDKIMGSWTFMEEIETLQQLKMTEHDSLLSFSANQTPHLHQVPAHWTVDETSLFFGQNQGSYLF